MRRRALPLLLTFVLLLTACADPDAETQAMDKAEIAVADTAALRRTYDEIDAGYEQVMAQYQQMASELPDDVRRRYDEMQQMHGDAAQMHGQVLHGTMMGRQEGMMGDTAGRMMGGETGGRMMGSDTDGAAHMGELRMMDQQMRAMHAEMAADLREAGFEEMAALHEQMTRHYEAALDALPETDQ